MSIPLPRRKPDFTYIEDVLYRRPTDRPVLFEFFLNGQLHEVLAADDGLPTKVEDENLYLRLLWIKAFRRAGYDYVTCLPPKEFAFTAGDRNRKETISINEGGVIKGWGDFEKYAWPEMSRIDYGVIEKAAGHLPEGMKFISSGPGGVEENVIRLTGYEDLCYMMADDEELVSSVFEAVGSRLVHYYAHVSAYPFVGACISNDDWGFKTQTLLSLEQMEKYLFPWHKKIVEVVHANGKPVILHSCGNATAIMDKIYGYLAYDAKHSYEDAIMPIEESYERYYEKIALLGGIDVDFVTTAAPDAIYRRSKQMIERSQSRGGYGLGTGNSVPPYIPHKNYFAMVRAALD